MCDSTYFKLLLSEINEIYLFTHSSKDGEGREGIASCF